LNMPTLTENVVTVLKADPRIRAAWLAGSRGRGTDDQYSDLDIWVVTAPEDRKAILADWPSLADKLGPTVLCQRVGLLPVYTHITPEWDRYDVLFGTTEDVPRRSRDSVRVLFDRDGLDALLAEPGPPQGPDPARVQATTTEFLRVLGLLPVVIGREEYVVAASGAGLLRTLLIQLMAEDTHVADRGGALKLNGLLPPQRLQALAGLPPIAATRESAIEAHLACARLFLPYARDLSERTGAAWPAELEAAARSHLRATLSITL
jgi:predicted nucleotidyltransferase